MGTSGVVQSLFVLWIERDGLVQRRDRLLRMSRVRLNNAHPQQRLKIARLQIKLCLQRPQRLLRLAGLVLSDSEKELDARKLRIELSRTLQRTARVLWLTF